MKAVITGATGFVGRRLVPLISADGADLILVGRDAGRLSERFPAHETCDYDSLPERAVGYGTLVHLAVANNDSGLTEAEFFEANVELLKRLAARAVRAGVSRFVNVSSVHALDDRNQSAYARSKREGARQLAAVPGLESVTVYLPLVYGDGWSGKLGFLNRLPEPFACSLFRILQALKATVHVSRLADLLKKADQAIPSPGTLILSDGQQDNPVFQGTKRLIDLVFAISIMVFFWWLLALVWIAIRLHSPGPGLFRQTRVGRGGRPFTCYKFRTMKQGTAQAGTHEVSAVAVTDGLGSFLRRSKLDELPQILNIFRDEISLVGPRPCLPVQAELVEARRRRGVLEVKPGITGLAQIEGIDMSDPERLARRDADYVALQSLTLDLGILIATGLGRGQGDKIAKGPEDPIIATGRDR